MPVPYRAAAVCGSLLLTLPVHGLCQADGEPWTWALEAGLSRTVLAEWAADGRRLLREAGPVARLQARAQRTDADGVWLDLRFGAAGGLLDYQGQTQGGASHRTETRHRDVDATLFGRVLPTQALGSGYLGLRAGGLARRIAPRGGISGLDEDSRSLMAGMRWSGPAVRWSTGSGVPWLLQWEAEAWRSVQHRLRVDYGGLYDPSRLQGGAQRAFALQAGIGAEGSAWQWSARFSRQQQEASDSVDLRRSGQLAGTVSQPRLRIDEVGLQVARRF